MFKAQRCSLIKRRKSVKFLYFYSPTVRVLVGIQVKVWPNWVILQKMQQGETWGSGYWPDQRHVIWDQTRIGRADKWPGVSQNYQILFLDTILSRNKITSSEATSWLAGGKLWIERYFYTLYLSKENLNQIVRPYIPHFMSSKLMKKCWFVEPECMTFVRWNSRLVSRRNCANIPSCGIVGSISRDLTKNVRLDIVPTRCLLMNGLNHRDWNRSTKQLST